MANTPAHAGDDTINALVELEHEVVYLRSVPADDWQIDIDDDGAMTGRCPCCGCKDISYVTPEWLECLGCGHKDGQKYRRREGVTAGAEPAEWVELPREYVDE